MGERGGQAYLGKKKRGIVWVGSDIFSKETWQKAKIIAGFMSQLQLWFI